MKLSMISTAPHLKLYLPFVDWHILLILVIDISDLPSGYHLFESKKTPAYPAYAFEMYTTVCSEQLFWTVIAAGASGLIGVLNEIKKDLNRKANLF